MAQAKAGLATAEKVIDLADALGEFVTEAQKNIKERFDNNELSQVEAQELFISLGNIGHISNMLYISAAQAIVGSLSATQTELLSVIKNAQRAIAKIERAKDIIDLVADILALAGAINTGKPGPILSALKEVQKDIKAI